LPKSPGIEKQNPAACAEKTQIKNKSTTETRRRIG
jgi:hypothetical protein